MYIASDDFDVLGVDVALSDGAGNPIESGAAIETPANSSRWIYIATAAVATGTTVRIAVTTTRAVVDGSSVAHRVRDMPSRQIEQKTTSLLALGRASRFVVVMTGCPIRHSCGMLSGGVLEKQVTATQLRFEQGIEYMVR